MHLIYELAESTFYDIDTRCDSKLPHNRHGGRRSVHTDGHFRPPAAERVGQLNRGEHHTS